MEGRGIESHPGQRIFSDKKSQPGRVELECCLSRISVVTHTRSFTRTLGSHRWLFRQDSQYHCEGEDIGTDTVHAARRAGAEEEQVGPPQPSGDRSQNN